MKKKNEEHIHKWELQSTSYQFPLGTSGTSVAVEYAYLLCQCGEVRKVKIKKEVYDT
jgi:hypothetical protein